MKGKDRFTAGEATRIRQLLRQRATAERAQQKHLRDELRGIGFYISDWSGPGFTPSDFDALVRSRQITIVESTATGRPSTRRAQTGGAPPLQPKSSPSSRRHTAASESAEVAPAALKAVRASLTAPRHVLANAEAHVDAKPGLYAIHGRPAVWRQLGLGDPPDDRPLYVGKAEDSLVTRDLKTHFADGRTGSSTVRRSFAALLRETLDLRAQPRNPDNPERFANFGLSPDGDERVTRWMREHLTLAVWPKPHGVDLLRVELKLLTAWEPPLNLKDVRTPWSDQLSRARKRMANDARVWANGT